MAGLFGVCLWHIGTGVIADDPRGCCGRGRVVASDVFPVSLPAAGGVQPGLPCGPGSFFKCVCRDMRRMPGGGARLARCAGNASLCMRGHARAGGCQAIVSFPGAFRLGCVCRRIREGMDRLRQ